MLDLARILLVPLLAITAACSVGVSVEPPPSSTVALRPIALPGARHGHRMEKLEGGLLVFGGFGDPFAPDREARQTWWLAAGAGAWERRADMGTPRAFFGSAVVDGAVYAIGEGLDRYDFAADRWQTVLGPEELPRSHFASAAIGDTLYVLGGYGGPGGRFVAVDITEAGSAAVRVLEPPPGFKTGDHFHVMHALGGELHVLGGYDGEVFEPQAQHVVLWDATWHVLAPPPTKLWAKFAVQARDGDVLYHFGDPEAWRYDAGAARWDELAPREGYLVMPQAVVLGRELWVVGGEAEGRRSEAVLERYDLERDLWKTAPPAERSAGDASK